MKRLFIIPLIFLSIIFSSIKIFERPAHAGYISCLIVVCDPSGNCEVVNQWVWENGWQHCT